MRPLHPDHGHEAADLGDQAWAPAQVRGEQFGHGRREEIFVPAEAALGTAIIFRQET
ncbi:hypothetical protein [Actinomadura luteofluorescens]|uniref:hypothetical protein n=1 Tax=Actinomadura luteofluorescens TaxID=46163 RepID=UPI003D8C6A9F